MYRFNAIPFRIPARGLKFKWKDKGNRIAIIILKKNTVGGNTLPNLKTYSTRQCGTGKETYINWWNRIESSEIDPHKYGYLVFAKGTEAIQ